MEHALRLRPESTRQAATGLKAVSHPARLKILCALVEGERSVNEITELTGLSQSGASQHLAKMMAAGLLVNRRSGNQVFYVVPDVRYKNLIDVLCSIYGGPA